MKTRTLLCSIAIASLGFASLAQAQPHHGGRDGRHDAREARHDRGPNHRAGKEVRRDHRDARRDLHDRRNDRHDARHDRRDARHYYNARSPEFRRGGRLPPEVRHTHYVVNDWRGHRLAPPPRGHHWVQVGPDYVLAAVATGLIVNLVLSQ